MIEVAEIIKDLEAMGETKAREGMARVGIDSSRSFCVSIPNLRKTAKKIGKDQDLALGLWAEGLRETMILASMIAEPARVDSALMESWALDFYDWEVCDQAVMNLFEKTTLAWEVAPLWSQREEEFVKRAGFVLMARLAVSDKKASDEYFFNFFPLIERESDDDRNMVKKAVNWALRQIGKRNLALNTRAIASARRIQKRNSKAARWIAADALRELESRAVRERLQKKKSKGS